jgi:hypothetical protein
MMDGRTAKRLGVRSAAIVLLLAVLAELAVRMSGMTDFPAYSVDADMGYVVRPNQSGRFLTKNSWAFNSKSMPTVDEWNPSLHPDILLIGNSIVMGGNRYDQSEKLTPVLSARLGGAYRIWPAAIGGWTTVNEMAYLRRNPDVVQAANFFVWEYMSGGLSGLNSWAGDAVFPTERPVWASGYVLRRYVLPRIATFTRGTARNELPRVGALREEYLQEFRGAVAALGKASGLKPPGLIFLYPTLAELQAARRGQEWLPERPAIAKLCADYGLPMIDIAAAPAWRADLYRDGVHPTGQGNVILASILAAAIETGFAGKVAAVGRSADRVRPAAPGSPMVVE